MSPSPLVLLTLYGVLVLFASLAGGWVPLWIELTHQRMQLAISFVAGVMLGVGVLHLLPHALATGSSPDGIFGWMLVGFLVMFFLERFFSFHHHDTPEELSHHAMGPHDHAHHPAHDHGDDHTITWYGAAIGLTLHGLVDGIALAASVEAESTMVHRHAATVAGLGTFLGVALHKPFDALSLGTLMAWGGGSRAARHLVNLMFASVIPIGALIFHYGLARWGAGTEVLLANALGFSAGTFLCISLSDLLPELQFHRHDRIKLSAALLLGVAVAWSLVLLEGGQHDHGPRKPPAAPVVSTGRTTASPSIMSS
ncbi:MAG: ZIP family metal transporter [Pirellulales bacterium]|nr:ZIP family metal transporter [Pirellulales bacterium]